jgi:hypothetical protein
MCPDDQESAAFEKTGAPLCANGRPQSERIRTVKDTLYGSCPAALTCGRRHQSAARLLLHLEDVFHAKGADGPGVNDPSSLGRD